MDLYNGRYSYLYAWCILMKTWKFKFRLNLRKVLKKFDLAT